ncbi:hypothetical protein UlMin_017248 [Ulmus minor]
MFKGNWKELCPIYAHNFPKEANAIRGLDNRPFGYDRCKLSVEWARGKRGRHRDGARSTNQRPTKTLFVINFDPLRTQVRDIERHFEPYGKVLHVQIRRNFAFVQFKTQEDATKALKWTQMRSMTVVFVEYALKDDDERGDRSYDSPRRGVYGRCGDSPYGRSPSPMYHRHPSPEYGRPRSPAYDKRRSPDYGRNINPKYGSYRSRSPILRSRT